MEEAVKNEPKSPTPKQSPMDKNSFGKSLGIISSISKSHSKKSKIMLN